MTDGSTQSIVVANFSGIADSVRGRRRGWRTSGDRASQLAAVRARLEKLKPVMVVVFTGGTGGARYQLPMWLPYIEKIRQPYIIVTKDVVTVPVIARLTSVPVVCANVDDPELLDLVMGERVRLAFYVRNTRLNRGYFAYRHVRHVFLNHGDSDKPANFNPLHRKFDNIFVCGESAIRRYAVHGVKIPRRCFAIVGRPQIQGVKYVTRPIADVASPKVLYAPTWRGRHDYDNYTSLPVGTRIVQGLLDQGATVIFRPHPLSRKPAEIANVEAVTALLERDARETGRQHVWGEKAEKRWSVKDCTNASDALVSDVSSVVSDYLASGKPYALVAMDRSVDRFREEFASAGAGYVVDRDLETLPEQLALMLGTDPLREARREMREQTLGGMTGDEAAAAFVKVSRKMLGVRDAKRKGLRATVRAKVAGVKRHLVARRFTRA